MSQCHQGGQQRRQLWNRLPTSRTTSNAQLVDAECSHPFMGMAPPSCHPHHPRWREGGGRGRGRWEGGGAAVLVAVVVIVIVVRRCHHRASLSWVIND